MTCTCGKGDDAPAILHADDCPCVDWVDGELESGMSHPFKVWREGMMCDHCQEPILQGEEIANIITMDAHRECSLRSVLGGIGHLIDHAHFCKGMGDPDAGLDRRTSALMVDVWVARKGVDAAARIGSS